MTWAAAIAAFAAAACLGFWAVPAAAAAVLKRKRAAMAAWWADSAAAYREWSEGNGRPPERRPFGREGDLAVWAEEAVRLARCGELGRAELAEAAALGLDVGGAAPGEPGVCASRPYAPGPARRAAAACGVGAAAALASCLHFGAGHPAAASALFAAIGFLAVVSAECDVAERVIPWEVSAAIGVLAACRQLCFGFWDLAVAAACAVGIVFAFRGLGALLGPGSVGAGDVRMAAPLALACGVPGMAWGAAVSAPVMLAMPLARRIFRPDEVRRGYPFGPVLAVWTIGGMALGAVAPVQVFQM